MTRKRKHKVLKMSLKEVFATQLVEDSFVKVLSFMVMDDWGRFQVQSIAKNKIDELSDSYDLIEANPNRLPVFVAK